MSDEAMVAGAALGAIMGLIFWAGLLYWNSFSLISIARLSLILFSVGLACRIIFALFTPTFYAPDEQPHFNYVKYLYEHRSLPVQTSQTGAETKDWEYYQPPLYYLIAVPIYGLVGRLFEGDGHFFLVRAMRPLSILCWGINVVFALKILRNLQLSDQFIRVFALSMVCLLPTYTFLSASINNDNLVITLGGALLFLLSGRRSYRRTWLMGLLLGLALLTKLTAIVYIFAIAGVLGAQAARRSLSLPQASLHFLLIVTVAGILSLPWALRNTCVYGDIYPEEIANVPVQWESVYHAFRVTHGKLQDTFWSAAGIHNRIRFLPVIGVSLTYWALAGVLYGLVAKTKSLFDYLRGDNGSFLIGTGLAIGVNLGLALRFGMLYDQGQGRFLFPLLIPISILMAVGIKSWDVTKYLKNIHLHTVSFFVLYALSFTGYSLGFFARWWLKLLATQLG